MSFFMQAKANEPYYELVQLESPTQNSFPAYEDNNINKPIHYEVKLLDKTYGEVYRILANYGEKRRKKWE